MGSRTAIKLSRTDTTLDLSQKAEKGMNNCEHKYIIYTTSSQEAYVGCHGPKIWELHSTNHKLLLEVDILRLVSYMISYIA